MDLMVAPQTPIIAGSVQRGGDSGECVDGVEAVGQRNGGSSWLASWPPIPADGEISH
jgi:hypothetical protein